MKVNNFPTYSFPTLYKKTSTGAIQFWKVKVFGYSDHAVIETVYGQFGGAEQQTEDVIRSGKNIGKANETTPVQQASYEANSKWESKLKKGYVEKLEDAEAGKTDKIIEGGVLPMLAHKYSEHSHKIKFPALVQPKLDGIRCIAILKDGKCTLWSRTRKPITSVPHIVEALEGKQDMILDGELFSEKYRQNFEHIVHLVRQEVPTTGYEEVEYHIYDAIQAGTNEQRQQWLTFEGLNKLPLVLVATSDAYSSDEVNMLLEHYLLLGYEGCMIRNKAGLYVNKRSHDLLKYKSDSDSEFEIVGIEEGRGKLSGHVGAFVCKTSDGQEFKAKMAGDTSRLKDYFENHSLWKDKKLTVKYQSLTGYGIPRFPVGKVIRDYE